MTPRTRFIAWTLLGIAIAAWVAVGYAGMVIVNTATERESAAVVAARERETSITKQRLVVLAESTKAERAALHEVLGADVVALADAIEGAGRSAGITLSVDNAVSEGEQKANEPVRSVAFIVSGSGSFAGVMHAVHLLENLPYPSSVHQVELGRVPDGSAWQLIMRVRIYTSAPQSL